MAAPDGAATTDVGGGGESSALYISISQFDKFGGCEKRWLLGKTTPEEDLPRFAKTDALDLGTLIHTLKAAWWAGKPWREAWLSAAIEAIGDPDVGWKIVRNRLVTQPGWEVPTIFLRAVPIMEAWDRVHGTSPAKDKNPDAVTPDGEVIDLKGAVLLGSEIPFDLPVPGVPDVRIRGFLDGLLSRPVDKVRVHDEVWVVEEKTMGRWGREDQVAWDPQLHIYGWAARQMFNVQGAVFEAISTYDYKPPEGKGIQAVDHKRFKRIGLRFDDRMIDLAVNDMRQFARRAKALLKNPGLVVRSVGSACTYCDFRKQCLTPWESA